MNRLAAVLVACLAAPAFAGDTVPDSKLKEAIDAFHAKRDTLAASGGLTAEAYQKLQEGALEGLPIESLTPRQIAKIHREGLFTTNGQRHEAIDRLDAFMDDTGEDGAVTAILRLALLGGRGGKQQAALLDAALTHPGLPGAIKSGAARDLFGAISGMGNPKLLQDAAPKILALESSLDASASPLLAQGLADYFDIATAVAKDAAARERVREKCVAFGRDALAKTEKDPDAFAEPVRNHIARTVRRLDGAAARGKLVGSAAPPLAIEWSSDPTLQSLESLKGKVVVLDFWATWCGPCVGSIPNVRELAAHYKGFPVAIVGVTSDQGHHHDPSGDVIDTKGNPAKEHELMTDFMKKKDITWTIAFSEEDVFNPEYGVQGIPHVAIVDSKGVVRYTDLHPTEPLAEKAKKIDALLKEAGLAAPTPPAGN